MLRLQSASNLKKLSSICQHTTWLAAQRHLSRHEETAKQQTRETPLQNTDEREFPNPHNDKQVTLQTL